MTASWTHPETGELISRDAVNALIATYRNSPRERQRAMAWDQLHRTGVQLHEIVSDLKRRLERGYDILEGLPDETREARWLQWLASYEGACDALVAIEDGTADRLVRRAS